MKSNRLITYVKTVFKASTILLGMCIYLVILQSCSKYQSVTQTCNYSKIINLYFANIPETIGICKEWFLKIKQSEIWRKQELNYAKLFDMIGIFEEWCWDIKMREILEIWEKGVKEWRNEIIHKPHIYEGSKELFRQYF